MALGGFDCEHCNCQPGEEWELRHGDLVVRTDTCPAQIVDPDYLGIVHLYGFYRDGVLAYAGGVMDQPAFYLQAMQIVGAIVAEHEESSR